MTTIYTLPACPGCMRSKAWMSAHGVEFTEVDLTQDDQAAIKVLNEWGYQAAPVVEAPDGTHWSGHNVELLAAHV